MKKIMLKKKNNLKILPVFFGSLLVAMVSVYLYSPVIKTNADSMIAGTRSSENLVKFTAKEVLSLNLSTDHVSFSILPTAEGTFGSGTVRATVDTNLNSGYELYFSSADSSSDLKYDDEMITSSFSGYVSSSSMQSNTWGYSMDGTSFGRVPTLLEPARIRYVDHFITDASEMENDITFGVKIDNTLGAGKYTKTVKVTLVSAGSVNQYDEFEYDTFSGIRFMHQMTSAICEAETTPAVDADEHVYFHTDDTSKIPTTYLRDIRDNHFYYVAKLSDGNCWMLQDLSYNIDNYSTSEYTDLNTKDYIESMDADDAIYYESWNSRWGWLSYPAMKVGRNSNLNTAPFRPDPVGKEGSNDSYGGFYNWFAASAGNTSDANQAVTANDSICPKGWRLPVATGNKSMDNLIDVYGLKYDYEEDGYIPEEEYEEVEDKKTALRSMPLYIDLSGRLYVEEYGMYTTDSDYAAYYWTADTVTNAQVNYVQDDEHRTDYIGAAKVFYIGEYSAKSKYWPMEYEDSYSQYQNLSMRHNGYSIRCVAR